MPQHPCPCPWTRLGGAYGWGMVDGASVAAALGAARDAALAHAVLQATRLATGHDCAPPCVMSRELRWRPLKPQDAFIVSVRRTKGRPYVFTAFAIGQFSAWIRCRDAALGLAEALESAGLSGGLPWSIRTVE